MGGNATSRGTLFSSLRVFRGMSIFNQNGIFKKETMWSQMLFHPDLQRFTSFFPPPPLLPFFQEEKMLGILVRHKVRSGVSRRLGMEVDGLPFHSTHAQMIQKLLDVTTGST